MEYEKIENKLYASKYGVPKKGNHDEIWEEIKNNKELLKWAITKIRDKFDERDIVNGLTICDNILIDYNNIDKDIYQELISLIYSNKDIARIVLDGASNGGYSYLLMALWNYDFKLTDSQKEFAVNEAMNKIGTVKYKMKELEYSKKLDNEGISDDDTVLVDLGGSVNPIGKKTGCEFTNYMFNTMSDTQAHGVGEFDIRYHILRNSNFSIDEKRKLIYDFWADDLEYSEFVDAWKWNVLNEIFSYDSLGEFDINYLYEYKYVDILYLIGDREETDKIWEEIMFCELMEYLRPMTYEDDKSLSQKKLSLKK